jgi:hypothetical protein
MRGHFFMAFYTFLTVGPQREDDDAQKNNRGLDLQVSPPPFLFRELLKLGENGKLHSFQYRSDWHHLIQILYGFQQKKCEASHLKY